MEKEKNKRSGYTLAIIVFIAISIGLISIEIYSNVKDIIHWQGPLEKVDHLAQPGVKPDSIQVADSSWKEPEWIGE